MVGSEGHHVANRELCRAAVKDESIFERYLERTLDVIIHHDCDNKYFELYACTMHHA